MAHGCHSCEKEMNSKPHATKPRRDVMRHRTMLLDAASRVFREQGPLVSMEAVVEASGIGRATLYRHFPDRTALLLALFDRDIGAVIEAVSACAPSDKLLAMLGEMGRITRHGSAIEDAWHALSPGHPEMQARRAAWLVRLQQPLADAIAAERVRDDLTLEDVIHIGRMIVAANRSARGDERVAERVLALILEGIGGRR